MISVLWQIKKGRSNQKCGKGVAVLEVEETLKQRLKEERAREEPGRGNASVGKGLESSAGGKKTKLTMQ